MNKYLFCFSLVSMCLTVVIYGRLYHERAETMRLKGNQHALLQDVKLYENRLNQSVASVEALKLTVGELQMEKSDALKIIESLNVKLRMVASLSVAVAHSNIVLNAPLRDSIVVSDNGFIDVSSSSDSIAPSTMCSILCDTLSSVKAGRSVAMKTFSWCDEWACVSGVIFGDSVECMLSHTDTLYQVVHRVPKRFLCFKYGIKAIRQEMVSTSPHNRIVYSEYVTVE